MLEVQGLCASIGSSRILFGIDLACAAGQVTALMGRNGMGKTTTINSLMGMTRISSGQLIFDGQDLVHWPVDAIARLGIGVVPEGRQIFPNLTVRENLIATSRRGVWDATRVLTLFPRLKERNQSLGADLSGGEQQMLAIGRALMTNPKLLILDEATEGLAPLICQEIWSVLLRLKQEGQSALIVDKNVRALSKLADKAVVVEKGRTVFQGSMRDFADDPVLSNRYLGV